MNHAVAVVRPDAGHERSIFRRVRVGWLIGAIDLRLTARSTQLGVELHCPEGDADADAARLHRRLPNGEAGRIGTFIHLEANARNPIT
jgi:hypothetical protein